MKSKLTMFLAVMMFASIGSISSAYAQGVEIEKANIPFDFYVGEQKMPAGNYTIGVYLDAEMITVRDGSGKHLAFLMGTSAGEGGGMSELVFEHSGNTYVLQKVESDVIDLTFGARIPEQGTESRMASPAVEVALNRL